MLKRKRTKKALLLSLQRNLLLVAEERQQAPLVSLPRHRRRHQLLEVLEVKRKPLGKKMMTKTKMTMLSWLTMMTKRRSCL
jgi:hypothetical protein